MSYPAPDILQYDDWFDDPPPRPEEEVADWYDNAPSSYEPSEVSNIPEGGGTTRKDQLKDVTMHEKMYKIATDKYNPFAIGGSESIHDFD